MNGVSGTVLGNPVPGGDARAFADVANALGSLSASTSDIIYAVPQAGQLVTVRLDNGVTVVVTQLEDAPLRAGDAVRIEGAGVSARVERPLRRVYATPRRVRHGRALIGAYRE
jgi:outer membrane lipoprotein SlyB